MATRKISPELEKELLKRSAEGHTTRALSAWVLAEKGIKISHQAIGNLLRQTRRERSEVTKAVVREQLTKTVTADVDVLGETQDELRRVKALLLARALRDLEAERVIVSEGETKEASVESVEQFRKVCDTLTKVTNTKMHFAGADEPSTPAAGAVAGSVICIPPESED